MAAFSETPRTALSNDHDLRSRQAPEQPSCALQIGAGAPNSAMSRRQNQRAHLVGDSELPRSVLVSVAARVLAVRSVECMASPAWCDRARPWLDARREATRWWLR